MFRLAPLLALLAVPTASFAAQLDGVIDLHCHTAPDIRARDIDDVALAKAARSAGMRGVVLKSHVTATSDRATLAMRAVPGIEVWGGIALNREVGGLNAAAIVALAKMEGRRGRFVWLPTRDARKGDAGIEVVRAGAVVPDLDAVLAAVAAHDLVLATGHTRAVDADIVLAAARRAGVQRLVITHALSPALGYDLAALQRAVDHGALLEACYLTHLPSPPLTPGGPPRPGVPLARLVEAIRTIGAAHFILSSDLGQPENPSHPEGLAAFMHHLETAGIPVSDLHLMTRTNPARLLGLSPLDPAPPSTGNHPANP